MNQTSFSEVDYVGFLTQKIGEMEANRVTLEFVVLKLQAEVASLRKQIDRIDSETDQSQSQD